MNGPLYSKLAISHSMYSFLLPLLQTLDMTGTAYAFTGTPLAANIPRSTSALQMSSIKGVKAREILDSRGNPTVEVRFGRSNMLYAL